MKGNLVALRSRVWRWGLASGLLIGLGFPGVGRSVQAPWITPVSVSEPGQFAVNPDVAITAEGGAVAVWNGSDGISFFVNAATRESGGTFGPPVKISGPVSATTRPRVAIARDGTTVVSWTNTGRVFVVTGRHGVRFGSVEDLGDAEGNLSWITVVPSGETTVFWNVRVNGFVRLRSATRLSNLSFQPAVDLSPADAHASEVEVASAASGAVGAVWSRTSGQQMAPIVVQASLRLPGGAFSPPRDLSPATGGAFGPSLSLDPRGAGVVAWSQSNGTHAIVQAVSLSEEGTFGVPVPISQAGGSAADPDVNVGEEGTAVVVWSRLVGVVTIVEASVRAAGRQVFATPAQLSDPMRSAFDHRGIVSPDGTVNVLWLATGGGALDVIQTAAQTPGGTFAPRGDLSARQTGVGSPRVAVAADGGLVAVWTAFNPVHPFVQASWSANPPVALDMPTISGVPLVGGTLTCRIGRWIGATTTFIEWVRDGAITSQSEVFGLTPIDRGRLVRCRVRAINLYGDAVQTTPPLVVGPPLPPQPRELPRVVGTLRVGSIVYCKGARFSGAERLRVRWIRNGRRTLAVGGTYRIRRPDAGSSLACRVIAYGPGGAKAVLSAAVRVRK